MSGFGTASSEITLVLFTTLAPSGAIAYAIMAAVVLRAKDAARQRVGRALLIPFLICLIGLVASATHLGNPDNALYVFARVGRSPLSTEVCAAVLFLGASGIHWLYQFAEHSRPRALDVLLLVSVLAALCFLMSVAFAYASRTVITWNTPFVPLALCLNALVGGPVVAIAGLSFSRWEPLYGRAGRFLLALSLSALLANVAVYAGQGASLSAMKNYLTSADQLVPHFDVFVLVFFILVAAGLLIDAIPLVRKSGLRSIAAPSATALVFAGIFVMRFSFYMMHMTKGISF